MNTAHTTPVFTIPEDYYQEYVDKYSSCEYYGSTSETRIYLHIAMTWSHFCHFLVQINPEDDIAYFQLPYTEYWRYACCKSTDKPSLRQYGFIKFHLHGKALKVFQLPFISSEFIQDDQGKITAIQISVHWRRIL